MTSGKARLKAKQRHGTFDQHAIQRSKVVLPHLHSMTAATASSAPLPRQPVVRKRQRSEGTYVSKQGMSFLFVKECCLLAGNLKSIQNHAEQKHVTSKILRLIQFPFHFICFISGDERMMTTNYATTRRRRSASNPIVRRGKSVTITGTTTAAAAASRNPYYEEDENQPVARRRRIRGPYNYQTHPHNNNYGPPPPPSQQQQPFYGQQQQRVPVMHPQQQQGTAMMRRLPPPSSTPVRSVAPQVPFHYNHHPHGSSRSPMMMMQDEVEQEGYTYAPQQYPQQQGYPHPQLADDDVRSMAAQSTRTSFRRHHSHPQPTTNLYRHYPPQQQQRPPAQYYSEAQPPPPQPPVGGGFARFRKPSLPGLEQPLPDDNDLLWNVPTIPEMSTFPSFSGVEAAAASPYASRIQQPRPLTSSYSTTGAAASLSQQQRLSLTRRATHNMSVVGDGAQPPSFSPRTNKYNHGHPFASNQSSGGLARFQQQRRRPTAAAPAFDRSVLAPLQEPPNAAAADLHNNDSNNNDDDDGRPRFYDQGHRVDIHGNRLDANGQRILHQLEENHHHHEDDEVNEILQELNAQHQTSSSSTNHPAKREDSIWNAFNLSK